jgi:hypothetical protein
MTEDNGSKAVSANNYLDSKFILQPNETLRGLGYGDYAQRHLEHVASEQPDSFNKDGGILFLRSSIVESYTSESVIGSLRKFTDEKVQLIRTHPFSQVISTEDTICVTPLFSCFSKGQEYFGEKLDSIEGVYEAGRRDMRSSPAVFLIITPPGGEPQTVKDMDNYWVETRPFNLSVPENSRLGRFFSPPLIAGTEYKDTVVVGYFVILKNLSEGFWNFVYGGIGTNDYITYAKMDVLVQEGQIRFPVDISKEIGGSKGTTKDLDKMLKDALQEKLIRK